MTSKPASGAAPVPNARTSNGRLGLAYMFAGFSMFGAADAIAKVLTETLDPVQIAWSRQSGLLLGILVVLAIYGFKVLKTTQPKLQIARGVLAATSAILFVTAVAYVPLAEAVALTFVAPFVVTIMGALLLKEHVGLRRWSAVAIGFAGTMIVIRPGLGALHPAAFLLILAATAFALRQILSRVLVGGDNVMTTVAYTAIVSWLLLCFPLPFFWQTPATGQEWVLLVALGLLAAVGETLVIMALGVAQAVIVAPVQYVLIIWGTLYGYLIFGHLPDFWTVVGALIIVATGLYVFHRERLASRS